MRGLILAGGVGSRMYPMSAVVNKQLLPVHDKPMIYYPLTTLISSGISDIGIIANPNEVDFFDSLLGTGGHLGLKITYFIQDKPKGVPEAFLIADDFIKNDNVTLILGDNIFVDSGEIKKMIAEFTGGASVLGYQMNNPQNFGVIEFDANGMPHKIIEKPKNTDSRSIVPGLYVFDETVTEMAKSLKLSPRGEFEITDLNMLYLNERKLSLTNLSRGSVWIDAGAPASYSHASNYIANIEKTHGLKIGCPEEAAFRRGFIEKKQLQDHVCKLPNCDYRDYLERIINDA